MEDQSYSEFSWTSFFIVTGFSCLLFTLALKLLGGEHHPYFLYTGVGSLVMAAVVWAASLLIHMDEEKAKKKKRIIS